MPKPDVPLTGDDLIRLGKQLKVWEKLLVNDYGGYTKRADMVTRIEVTRPDDDDDEVIGHFVLYDGWLGFQWLDE